MKRELWLFTRQFPEGRGEAFLESALPVWAEHFERIRILPMYRGTGGVVLPAGVEVVHLWEDMHRTIAPLRTLMLLPRVLRTMHDRSNGWPSDRRGAQEALSHARQILFRAERLAGFMTGEALEESALLSVWMEDWVSVLGSVRVRGSRVPFSTLAHGWDLYAHRRGAVSIPYRSAQMEQVARVFCISEHGASYLRQRYPAFVDKVKVTRLGTTDHGIGPWSPSHEVRLVSSAYLRPPKRMDRLIDVLHRVMRPVHWIHFGDGPELEDLRQRARSLPGHIRVEWRGAVPNTAVVDHFRRCPVDLCVLFSDDEGVPVSLMEAASFGVPLLADAVGGVGEVVTPRSGVLVPPDAPSDMVAEQLLRAADGYGADLAFRAGVRSFWLEHYSANKNFGRMARCL